MTLQVKWDGNGKVVKWSIYILISREKIAQMHRIHEFSSIWHNELFGWIVDDLSVCFVKATAAAAAEERYLSIFVFTPQIRVGM